MNSNLILFFSAVDTLILLSIIWYFFYINYLQKNGYEKFKKKSNINRTNKISMVIEPDLCVSGFEDICPIELPNTDDDVTDALKYIESANFAHDLLENLYEQTRV